MLNTGTRKKRHDRGFLHLAVDNYVLFEICLFVSPTRGPGNNFHVRYDFLNDIPQCSISAPLRVEANAQQQCTSELDCVTTDIKRDNLFVYI